MNRLQLFRWQLLQTLLGNLFQLFLLYCYCCFSRNRNLSFPCLILTPIPLKENLERLKGGPRKCHRIPWSRTDNLIGRHDIHLGCQWLWSKGLSFIFLYPFHYRHSIHFLLVFVVNSYLLLCLTWSCCVLSGSSKITLLANQYKAIETRTETEYSNEFRRGIMMIDCLSEWLNFGHSLFFPLWTKDCIRFPLFQRFLPQMKF